MNKKKKSFSTNKEVGASKAARVMLGSVDRRLIEPAAFLVRISGWVLVAVVIYLAVFGKYGEGIRRYINHWAVAYVFYMLFLEAFRKLFSEWYEIAWFRGVRILANVIMISILVSIAPLERHILIFAYTVPIFAAVVYAAENYWIKLGVYLLSTGCIVAGDWYFSLVPRLEHNQITTYAIALASLTVGFEYFRRQTHLMPSRLTEIVKELYKTLDLQTLMEAILSNAIDISLAHRGLIIIINPRTKRYVGHYLVNFEFKEDKSVDGLAAKCFVLKSGESYENPDIVAAFQDKSVYSEFFKTQPRSILAEPLYNRDGQVLGVLNVAREDTNSFDRITKGELKEFAFLVSNAIENCFEHREVNLREARSKEAGEKFVSAVYEDDVINILFEEVRQQIPHAEKLTLHQYTPSDNGLLPIHSYSLETTPSIHLWSSRKSRKLQPDLYRGIGIAGHALEIRDTVLVPDALDHPLFVELDHAKNIRSLLVAPLFDPKSDEMYGTISLESSKPSVFNWEDESTLTFLASQSSRAIAKIKGFQVWREQGGTLRKILEQLGSFNVKGTERELCEQIAETASRLLGFRIARVRILSKGDMLVTQAVTGVSGATRKKLLRKDLPYKKIEPFLVSSSKAESSFLIKVNTPGWTEFVDKYFHKPRVVNHKSSSWDVYDALITPLVNQQGEVIGILTLDNPESGSEPNPQTLELVGVFANAASWVIELGRYQRHLEEQRHRAKSFIDTISQDLAKGRDVPTISEVVVQTGAKLLSAEGCSLYLVRGNEIELTHSNYLVGTDYISRRKPISTAPRSGLTAWVAAVGEMVCFNNGEYKKHPAWAGESGHLEKLPSKACLSLLIAPVKDKHGKVIAVITLENKRTLGGVKDFDEYDKIRLQSLANEFGKAIEVIGIYDDIREWERSGLADDIHDLINWYHSGVVMWIEALDEWIKRGDKKKTKELMPELMQHAYTTVYELKTLHTIFIKKSFEASTLRKALEEIMSVWETRAIPRYNEKMKIHLHCPEDIELPSRLRNTLVRIASLAFSNAIQHSGILDRADIEIHVRVTKNEKGLNLSIKDNGVGMDYDHLRPGYGLDRIRQLTEKINNWGEAHVELEVNSSIGQGTEIFLHLTSKSENIPQ